MSCHLTKRIRGFWFLLLLLGAGSALAENIHPAVVRVVVPEGDRSVSYGSGTLVAASENTGLVLTNWHVVRDRKGQVEVVFPNGFRSAARVLRTDQDWDLAALLVWRPNVEPVRISPRAPQPGEVLSIAGYGKGDYRFATGKCVQFLSPGGDKPFDIVELSAGARQGDSGGPILNQRGEMAGVLFGSASGMTSGSHAVRVRNFLGAIDPQLADGRLAPQPKIPQGQYAQNPQNAETNPRVASEYHDAQRPVDNQNGNSQDAAGVKREAPQTPVQQAPPQTGNDPQPPTESQGAWIGVPGNFPGGPQSPEASSSGVGEGLSMDATSQSEQINGAAVSKASKDVTLWEQVKNVLSFIGCLAILVQVAKLLNPDGSKKGKGKKKIMKKPAQAA